MREGDAPTTWKPNRLGRSPSHLIETMPAREQCEVGFRSLTEATDTTMPHARLAFHLFAALQQFEHDLIRDFTRAGLAAAASCGRSKAQAGPRGKLMPRGRSARRSDQPSRYTASALPRKIARRSASVSLHGKQ
ncbi:recombinase family protein [Paracraurococcus ruber]|uniref:recombinase family protein n=1 Tax=Paracraurococcus ruber TaxID=77675 RepID=UPI001F0104B7|nr:recombinase family protein [Paracraurococcus ruber]